MGNERPPKLIQFLNPDRPAGTLEHCQHILHGEAAWIIRRETWGGHLAP